WLFYSFFYGYFMYCSFYVLNAKYVIALFFCRAGNIFERFTFGKKYFKDSMELEITIEFPRSTLEKMPDKDQVMKAISESDDQEMTFLEYKSRADSIEVCFRAVWRDMTHVQKLEKILKDKFPGEQISIKAVRI
ncbi:MAG: hypothetical protein J6W33_03790, partial [Spirochaetia bacterium]|nr:hypothetical protein [Spirochaetia bacterium]